MAHRKSSAIGDLHGRVENMVFRTRNGKNIAYAIPLNQKVSKSKKAVKARKNFAAAVSLAASVNSVPALQEIWSVAKVRGSNSFQKLISMNSRLAREGSLTTANVISPPGLPFSLTSASIENNVLIVSFVAEENSGLSFPLRLFVYLCFVNSNAKIVPMLVEITDPKPGGEYDLDIVLVNEVKKLLAKDHSPVVYLAAAGGTPYRKKVYWTSTASLALQD